LPSSGLRNVNGSIPFVDRVEELRKLMKWVEEGFYPVLFIYGPEGCGKTRLLRELVSRIVDRDDCLAIYIDAQEVVDPKRAIYVSRDVLDIVADIVSSLVQPVGKALAVYRVARILAERRARGKHVVIAIDDVAKPLGPDIVESYAKKLLDLVEELESMGASSVFIVATSSEGASIKVLARHNYVSLTMVWNLDPESFESLLNVLKAPTHLRERIYELLGGNPRLAIELAKRRWRIDELLEEVRTRIAATLLDFVYEYREELAEVVENVDKLTKYPTIAKTLLETNLVIPVVRPCLGYTPPPSKDLGIGRYYAWQAPAYMHVLRELLQST